MPSIGGALGGFAGGLGAGLLSGQQGTSGTRISQLTGGVQAGGLSTGFAGSPKRRQITVGSSAERQGLVSSIADLFGAQAGELGQLRSSLQPGFGALTKARREAIQNAARRSVGNLTDQLARRRVLGSSFGSDQIARAGREFGQAQAESDARSFLEELEANVQLLGQQSEAARQQFQTRLGELNLQADLALSILQGSQASVASAFSLSDQLRAAFQSQMVAGIAGGAGLLGAGVGGLFGGSAPAPAPAGGSIGGLGQGLFVGTD